LKNAGKDKQPTNKQTNKQTNKAKQSKTKEDKTRQNKINKHTKQHEQKKTRQRNKPRNELNQHSPIIFFVGASHSLAWFCSTHSTRIFGATPKARQLRFLMLFVQPDGQCQACHLRTASVVQS